MRLNSTRQPMRLLNVEDDANTARAVEALLRQAGHHLDTASCGEQAIQLATSTSYDLILLDIVLPDLSGFEVAKRLRGAGVETPILFQTGLKEVRTEIKRSPFEATPYLFKPFSKKQLLEEIENIVGTCRPPEATRPEKRKHRRVNVLKQARVVMPYPFDCAVMNVSEGGAAIRTLHSEIRIPSEFVLARRGNSDRRCEVRWRDGDRVGVAFKTSGS